MSKVSEAGLGTITICAVLISMAFGGTLDALWERGSCAIGPTDVVSFTVYLPLREEMMMKDDLDIHAALDDHLPRGADRTPAHEKLAVLRDWFAPANGHVAAVGEWLRPLNCTRLAFSFRCESALVRDVATTLLGSAERPAPLCQYAPAGITTRRRFGKVEPISSIFRLTVDELDAALIAAGMRSHVRHIDGLALHNHTIRARHHSRKRRAEPPRVKNDGAGSDPYSDLTWPLDSRAPVIVSLTSTSAIVALVCKNGIYPQAGVADCGQVGFSAITLALLSPDNSTFNATVTVPFGSATCGSAYRFVYCASSFEYYTLCQIDLSIEIAGYDTVQASTYLHFTDGTFSDVGYLCGWYGGKFYQNCSGQSTSSLGGGVPILARDIRGLYRIPQDLNVRGNVTVGIMEWTEGNEPEVFNVSDLVLYMNKNGLEFNVSKQLNLDHYHHPSTQGETTLDVDLVAGLVPGGVLQLISIYVDRFQNTPLGAWLTMIDESILKPSEYPSSVYSVSWTFGDPFYGYPECDIITERFRLMSIAGISVLSAAGDSGAGFAYESYSVVEFPNASPYCISVGGTALRSSRNNSWVPREVVCSAADGNIITTGGGVSDYYSQPHYQTPYANLTGRGAPDVAAIGSNIYIWTSGVGGTMFGTSASTPIFASILALVTFARQQRNLSSLPLAHLFLYNKTINGFFTDVVEGDNCAGESEVFPWLAFWQYNKSLCYSASVGWDAVSGLGSPRFDIMAEVALSWQPPAPPVIPQTITHTIEPPTVAPLRSPGNSLIIGSAVGASSFIVILICVSIAVKWCNKPRQTLRSEAESLEQELYSGE